MAPLHLATSVFLAGNQKAEKNTREEATKFEKFKRRKSREKLRKEF